MYNKMNYIFYASDMDILTSRRQFSKLDEGRKIACHIKNGLGNCDMLKFSDYQGEMIDADSVGVVFPAHSWGISLAVYSFINHLSVSRNTYVYAVSVGERIQADSMGLSETNNALNSFKRLFVRKGFGKEEDIYVSCFNIKRITDSTEEHIRYCNIIRDKISQIMRGILCYSSNSIREYDTVDYETLNYDNNVAYERACLPEINSKNHISLDNIYLDEDILAGVRLCRVM